MTGDQDVTRLATQAVADPFGRVIGLEVARRRERRERVANPPECLRGLAGAKFPAVPYHDRPRTARLRFGGQPRNLRASSFGERPARIDIRSDRVAVMN
jgi:hypothetical protein